VGDCRCGASWTGMRLEHCTVCHQTFTGTEAGDMHRTGDHALDAGPARRRCLTIAEMLDRGMVLNGAGYWMRGRPARPERSFCPGGRR